MPAWLVGYTYDYENQGHETSQATRLVYASSFGGACAILEEYLIREGVDNPRDFENLTVTVLS